MLNSRLLTELPYSPERLIFGYPDNDTSETDQVIHLEYLGLGSKLLMAADAYAESYDTAQLKTVLHFRDYLISKALLLTTDSVLYKNEQATELTAHARQVYKQSPDKEFYPYFPLNSTVEARFADLLGTLAHYYTYLDGDGYPLDYLNELLSFIWGLVGLDYAELPEVRLQRLFSLVGRDLDFDSLVMTELTNLFNIKDPTHENYDILLYARRNFLTVTDGTNFTQRVMTGTYSEELITVLAALLKPKDYEKVIRYVTNTLSILRPIGFNGLVQAIAVEGLVKAAESIDQLPAEQSSRLLNDYLTDEEILEERRSVIEPLYRTMDSLEYLSREVEIEEASLEYEAVSPIYYSWNAASPDVPGTADLKVGDLYKVLVTRDEQSAPRPLNVVTYYSEFKELTPTGPAAVQLTTSGDYTDEVVYTASNYTTNDKPSLIFITPGKTSPNVQVDTNEVTPVRGAVRTVTFKAKNLDQEPLVAVALVVEGRELPSVGSMSIEEFNNLREQSKNTVRTSNSLLQPAVEPSTTEDPATPQSSSSVTFQGGVVSPTQTTGPGAFTSTVQPNPSTGVSSQTFAGGDITSSSNASTTNDSGLSSAQQTPEEDPASSRTPTSTSRPTVNQPSPANAPASAGVNTRADRQLQRYSSFNALTATTRPRGGDSGKYEAQGLRVFPITASLLRTFFTDRNMGALEEYTGRMTGIVAQQQSTHMKSEVDVLKQWIKSIQGIVENNG